MGRPKAADMAELAARVQDDLAGNPKPLVRLRLLAIAEAYRSTQDKAAETFGVSRATLVDWTTRYRSGGAEALLNRPYSPRKGKLDAAEATILDWIDNRKDPDGNGTAWTLERLRQSIADRFGIAMSLGGLNQWLKRRGRTQRRAGYGHPVVSRVDACRAV
ncbi:MAG: helix-turn-helix domain-containing protein [Desulfovibrio sp.]|jgi:transposase|nr:helix-turn-helix domain-containing protein [Desulfovibrio sp.]